ncbi:MAG TPA: fibronectin type III domain-containing protein [Thermoanaerobaculia bacterium]
MSSLRTKTLALALFSVALLALPATAANAPSNLNATATSSSQINLTWTDNASDETGFTFAYDTNSALSNANYQYAGGVNTTSYSHTQRAAATTYFYKIKAEGNPDSTWTSVKSATTAPSGLTATAVSSSQINLSWTGNSGNANIVGYTLAIATNSAFTGASYQWVGGTNATMSYSHTNLYAGTTYYYKVKAEGTSDALDSPLSTATSATTSSAAPTAPSGLTASVISSSQINLTWIDNSNNETSFELKRATDSGFTQNVVWIGGLSGTSYSNTGLAASTTYYYKVRAKGATQDSVYSSAVSATTQSSGTIPTAPSGLTATAVSSSQINLSWTDNSNNETGFELKRATDSAFTQNVVWIGNIQGNSYSNTGLNASTTYYYKVRAEGTAGKSAYTTTANATTSSGSNAHFFGINAWMPYQIGGHTYYGDLELVWPTVQSSGVQIMRYGGNGVDHWADPQWVEPCPGCPPVDPCNPGERDSTLKQYVTMVQSMRDHGIEPILQVPYYAGTYNASQAADIVQCINGDHNLNVKYWTIGNEPNLGGGVYGSGYTASQIATYFRAFATAMKAVDPTIKIIGPDAAWLDRTATDLLTTPNGTHDITGRDANGNTYLDIFAFHTYPFNGQSSPRPTRAQIIANLMAPGEFNDDLTYLKGRLAAADTAHSRSGDETLKMAVTEANINYNNDDAADGPAGVGGKSFIGGQFWCEMMGIALHQGVDFMTFWSVTEGDGLSYLSSDGTQKRPSYYHFEMMAENFRGSMVTTTDNRGNIKVFAAKDVNQVAVILLNQESSGTQTYKVRLNNDDVSGTYDLEVNVNAALAADTSGSIENQSTIVLIFDAAGTLKKKIEYKLSHATASPAQAPSVTTYP